jgi:glycosyltransferase involved in cell wall biosynthesis
MSQKAHQYQRRMMNDRVEGGRRLRGMGPVDSPALPLVSVVTVVYNGAATLRRTIEGVLSQTYPNIEYIIVDGGSSDGTLDIIREYEDRLAYWTTGRDKGIYDAMNKGIAFCTGQWVGLINADDRYMPDTVERVVSAIRSNPQANVVHGDIWMCYPNGERSIKRARLSGFLLKYWEMVLNHPSFFVRRTFYDGRPFDDRLRVSADHKWTHLAYSEQPESFVYLPVPLAEFSVGGASMSVPLRRVLAEGRQVCHDLGMGSLETTFALVVRAVLYPLQHLKLRYNRSIAAKHNNKH